MDPRIEWSQVSAVGLDLMDTILRDPFRQAIGDVTGLPLETLASVRDPEAYHAFELGEIGEAEYGERFFRPGTGLRLDLAALWAALEDRFAWIDGMEPMMARLSERVPVHVLSNYSPWYERLRAQFGLDRFVTGHHPSFLIGARKPDPTYYRSVLGRTGLDAPALLFVDDRGVNVESARELGLPALEFTDAEALERDLAPILGRDPSRR